jgi:enterochelin esterase-like enzyme
MGVQQLSNIVIQQKNIYSGFLKREVTVDVYQPFTSDAPGTSLLLVNDGQDLFQMNFGNLLGGLIASGQISPLVAVGIHAGERFSEFGTAHIPDYKNRGEKAFLYQQFILKELMPFINTSYPVVKFKKIGIAGFSLGALSALDISWSNPKVFSVAGMFSGSFWWRSRDLDNGYDENTDRIIHQKIKAGAYHRGLRFYFTTGSLDETADRNNNGVIDSIDDTVDLISELEKLGYKKGVNISYINYDDGKHDIETWGKAMPAFLLWGWGKKKAIVR